MKNILSDLIVLRNLTYICLLGKLFLSPQQNWNPSQWNQNVGSNGQCRGSSRSQHRRHLVEPINGKWLSQHLMALTLLASLYLVLQCLADEMSSVLIRGGELVRISTVSAWSPSMCCEWGSSEMSHFANEVSRIYKMWEMFSKFKDTDDLKVIH